jgi:hypothetical protein
MSTGSLTIPSVVHKTPRQEKSANDLQNIIAVAAALKAAVEEVVQGASKSLQEAKNDPYGYA